MLMHDLEVFKTITEGILNAIQKDDLDLVLKLIDKRQAIIERLKEADLKEFENIAAHFNLIKLENKLNLLMKDKMNKLKQDMKKIKTGKQISQYFEFEQSDSILINKKI